MAAELEEAPAAEPTADPAQSVSTAFDAPEPEAEEPKEAFKPTSFIEQYQHMLDDEEPSLEPIRREPEPAPAPVENKLGAELDAMQSGVDEDEAALEAYMSNMLRRMRGEESSDDAAPAQPTVAPAQQQPAEPSSADEVLNRLTQEESPAEAVAEHEPLDLEKLRQSSCKPALPTDLAAMRELANSSARKAIARHHKKRHLEKALGLFLVCIIAVCVGGYMLLTGVAVQDYLGYQCIGGAAACWLASSAGSNS